MTEFRYQALDEKIVAEQQHIASNKHYNTPHRKSQATDLFSIVRFRHKLSDKHLLLTKRSIISRSAVIHSHEEGVSSDDEDRRSEGDLDLPPRREEEIEGDVGHLGHESRSEEIKEGKF
ncbi:hypothetical protein ACLOJK_008965 [Asimina triloba]